jgi:hypothetical protein
MADTPALEDMLRSALSGIDDEDVRRFYSYFDELKNLARSLLRRKARAFPGESAVAQSALLSMLAEVPVHQIPLTDVDEEGYPALWPLLLKYIAALQQVEQVLPGQEAPGKGGCLGHAR